jgi:hypothetical protein
MEGFKKQIYKKPEWQNEEQKDVNPENLEYSEKIANEKLEKILKPGFRGFGIRYMNIEEYRNLIETGKLSGEFTLFDKYWSSYKERDFSEFLEEFKTGYDSGHSISMTDWEEVSGLSSVKTMDVINGIKIIRNEFNDKDAVDRDRFIRQYLLRYIEKGIVWPEWKEFTKNFDDLAGCFSCFRTPNAFRNMNYDLKKLDDSDENLKIIKSFKENEDFLQQKGNLRKLLVALSSVYDVEGRQSRQYHVALIVDSKILDKSSNSWNIDYWKELYDFETEKIDKKEKNSSILGAISIYPLKEMHNEIIEIEKDSKDLAHPVFDHNGVVRWPKKEN